MREALRAFRIGIMRLLAPDVSGSIPTSAEDIALGGGGWRRKMELGSHTDTAHRQNSTITTTQGNRVFLV